MRVHATAPLREVEIVADGHVVKRWTPGVPDAEFTHDDTGRPTYYYARLVQEDGHYAWSSPVFDAD